MSVAFDPENPPESVLPIALARVLQRADANWARSTPSWARARVIVTSCRSAEMGPFEVSPDYEPLVPVFRLQNVPTPIIDRLFADQWSGGPTTVGGTIGQASFVASRAYAFGTVGFGGAHGRSRLGFQLFDWQMGRVGDDTIFVGTLERFANVNAWSNVRMREVMRLAHAYVPALRSDLPDIALVEGMKKRAARLALRWNGRPADLSREALARIVQAVSFVVGMPLHVKHFVGYDERGRRVGGCGSLYGRVTDLRDTPAPPIVAPGGAWAVPFLRRFAALMLRHPTAQELDVAVDAYLDSYYDHPNTAYLKLTVALEGIAQLVLNERGRAIGVHPDKRGKLRATSNHSGWKQLARELAASAEYGAWREHVRARTGDIDSILGFDRSAEDGWVDGVAKLAPPSFGNLDEIPAGQRVLAALKAVGARPDRAMVDESNDWHVARHTGVAPSPREEVHARLELLRGMLVLLLGRWAGYAGPTLGHITSRDRNGRPIALGSMADDVAGVPDDFSAQQDEARVRYLDEPWDAPRRERRRRPVTG